MKEFKGTNGHWQILKDDGELKIIQKGSIEKWPGWRSYSPVCGGVSSKQNAKLIASAPELLEALQRACQVYDALLSDGYTGYKDDSLRAHALIAKALGESK